MVTKCCTLRVPRSILSFLACNVLYEPDSLDNGAPDIACRGLVKGVQSPMAQGRSTEVISMINRIRTSRLSIKNSLSRGRLRRLRTFPDAPPSLPLYSDK